MKEIKSIKAAGLAPTAESADRSPTNTDASGSLRQPLAVHPAGYGAGAGQLITAAALDGDGVPVVELRLGNPGPECIVVGRRRTCDFCKEGEKKF